MIVDYEIEFKRLTTFLKTHKFEWMERVNAEGSLTGLSVTNFLCIMEFFMNLVCSQQQLNWKPVPILFDGSIILKISRENREKILFHIMEWQKDLDLYPKLIKSQITSDLPSWSMRRADLLISAMNEIQKLVNDLSGILGTPTPRVKRYSINLMDSVVNGSFDESQEDSSLHSASPSNLSITSYFMSRSSLPKF